MSTPSFTSTTQFINVLVSIDLVDGDYIVRYSPGAVRVRLPDTVISYQIVHTGGRDIRFVGMKHTPKDKRQLSQPAVSPSGRLLTINNANTLAEDIHLSLEFEDVGKGGFVHDPQVLNDPPPPPLEDRRATSL